MIIEKWKIAQTYTIGKYHIANKLPCQDRTFSFEGNGVKVIALSDGAGSQPCSEIGAEIVCKEICSLLSKNFNEYLLMFEYEKTNLTKHSQNMSLLSKFILDSLNTKLKDKAFELNVALKNLGCTLLFFAIKDNFYIMGHIGDGVIAGLFNENNKPTVKVISGPENGAASNITFFVTDSDSNEHLRLEAGKLENLYGVIMTSDGAGDVLFNASGVDKSVYELFGKFNEQTSSVYEKLLNDYLSKVISNYSTDDLSLNILYLEDINTETVSEEYFNYILDDITSEKQIIRKSQYCYYLDQSISSDYDLKDISDVRRYLK